MNDLIKNEEDRVPATVGITAVATRVGADVQAGLLLAKNYPRDELKARQRVVSRCGGVKLAQQAQYEYKRGDGTVTGPSIRLAEAIAQVWGNIKSGWDIVEQFADHTMVKTWAVDLETNTWAERTFRVEHYRDTKRGKQYLRDARDIYEHVANFAARRLRQCLLNILPGDVVEEAIEQCELTLKEDSKKQGPLPQQIANCLTAFEGIGVSRVQISHFLQHNVDASTQREVDRLRRVFASIRDGFSRVDEFFPVADQPDDGPKDKLGAALAKSKKAETPTPPPPPERKRHEPTPLAQWADYVQQETGRMLTAEERADLDKWEPERLRRAVAFSMANKFDALTEPDA